MIDFIVKNYQFIALVVAALVYVILLVVAVCRKKVDPTIEKVITLLPDFINDAEKRSPIGNGNEKKLMVLGLACAYYKHLTGVTISKDSHIYAVLSRAIENILSTPQKKGK